MIRHLAKHDPLPDYSVQFDAVNDTVVFTNRGTMSDNILPIWNGQLRPETFAEAKRTAPGWDVYYIEQEWRAWLTEAPRNPDAAFLGFCRKWHQRRGSP